MTGVPSAGRSWFSVRLPAVKTDSCSRRRRVLDDLVVEAGLELPGLLVVDEVGREAEAFDGEDHASHCIAGARPGRARCM
jgi:hypothetical protein